MQKQKNVMFYLQPDGDRDKTSWGSDFNIATSLT